MIYCEENILNIAVIYNKFINVIQNYNIEENNNLQCHGFTGRNFKISNKD